MSRKKRLLRAGCITLVLLGFVGYFAFSALLFPPFEGRYKAPISSLVPRTVDFFVARARLADAFSDFPTLKVVRELEGNEAYEALMASPEWATFKKENGVDEGLAQLQDALKQIPLGLDPLSIFGGNEVALAGNFEGVGWNGTDWAVYGRVSRAGKMALAGLRYPGMLGLGQQGLEVSRDGELFVLKGSSLTKPIHVARERDVAVMGTSAELVRSALELADSGSQDSLLLAATFGERVVALEGRDSRRRDIELVLDVQDLRQRWGMREDWPNPRSERFLEAFMGRLVQLGASKKVFGVVDFNEGVSVDLYGEFSSELISAQQARVYRERSYDRETLLDAARMAHSDSTLFVYLHGPIGTLLRMAVDSMEPAMRDNLQDALRQGNRYKGIDEVISSLESGMHDRLALIARPNDWPPDPRDIEIDPATGAEVYKGPPNDGQPVFAWTLVAWHEKEERLIELRNYIGDNTSTFGIGGREPGDKGYYQNTIGAFETREFWSQFVPGTGHIATINLPKNMMVTNRYEMLYDLQYNLLQRDTQTGRLSERPDFLALLDEVPESGNLFIWADPRSGGSILRETARDAARSRLENSLDLGQTRRELDVEVRGALFGGKLRNQLNADQVLQLDEELDRRVRTYRDETIAGNLAGATRDADRFVTYLEAFSSLMVQLLLSERDFELSIRAVTPYE